MDDPWGEPVRIVDADPAWPDLFETESARLRESLGGLSVAIDHIGSTAVPLPGKPIIDMQLAVHESDRAAALSALDDLGYEHHGQGAAAGRDYLTRRDADIGFNVHIFSVDSSHLSDNRAIRDYLRAHPGEGCAYVQHKQTALEQGFDDLARYSHAKGERVAAIREAAVRWKLDQVS